MARLPQEAVGLAKLAIDAAASIDRGSARDFDRLANSVLTESDDYKQRLQAMMQRKD